MKYFLIAGEASGDLHASHLIAALRQQDPEAEFRFFGGDAMAAAAGCAPLRHYRTLAYMGFIQVALHLRTILRGLGQACDAIREWRPDCLILVDYPGFNLKVAATVHKEALCPVYYYIAPKVWAWKERRVKRIRRDVDHIFSILPFEVEFFEKKHHCPVTYVGNPSLDEVAQTPAVLPPPAEKFIALLPGSRTAEIETNLPRMYAAARPFSGQGYRLVVAGAPSQPAELYQRLCPEAEVLFDQTFALLQQASAALVTSGTATLETALFGVPQVVCYYMRCGRLVKALRPYFLKVPFISLPNLICGREIIPELVASDMTADNIHRHLTALLPEGTARSAQRQGYEEMRRLLGEPGAPHRCAAEIIKKANK